MMGGCVACSDGCKGCWAARTASTRLKNHPLYKGLTKDGKWTGEIRLCTDIKRMDILEQPLHWKRPRRIGVQFMGDLFHPSVNIGFLTHVFDTIQYAPQHTFLILTKRPKQALKMMWGRHDGGWRYFREDDYHKNIHFGVTICNQKEMWKYKILQDIPATNIWISFEPVLTEIVTHFETTLFRKPDFVVIGCESGPNRRPCKREWIKSLYDQCKAAGVEVMVKQMAENEDGTGKVCHDLKRIKAILGD